MSLENLKRIRLLFPGVISVAFIYIIMNNDLSTTDPLKDYRFYIFSIIVSVFYSVINLREIMWKPIREKVINYNINNCLEVLDDSKLSRLSKTYTDIVKLLFQRRKDGQKRDAKIMRVFYGLIDQNDSLKTKSMLVRNNGAILTSLIDSVLISTFFVLIYLLLALLRFVSFNLYILLLFICVAIFSLLLILPSIKNHLKLSNEQLDIIGDNYSESIITALRHD